MALIVEDGTGLAAAESYASVAQMEAYAARMGVAVTGTAQEALLRRATLWLDATYRWRFTGYRAKARAQALEWPRVWAYYDTPSVDSLISAGYGYGRLYVAPNVVPLEVVNATIEAALREMVSPGAFTLGTVANGVLKMEKAGDTAQEFFPPGVGGSSSTPKPFAVIDAILSSLLLPHSGFTARAARG